MATISTMFQAFLTVCQMDGYGNLYNCKTFTPKEGASVSKTVCKERIKEFEGLLQSHLKVPYAVKGECKNQAKDT